MTQKKKKTVTVEIILTHLNNSKPITKDKYAKSEFKIHKTILSLS